MQILHCFEFLPSKLAEQNSKSCKIRISQHDALEWNAFTYKDQIDILQISNKKNKTGKPSSLQGCSILMTKLNKNLNLAITTKHGI